MEVQIPSLFITPASILMSGITGAGKTTLLKRIITEPTLFSTPPKRIILCYGVWQSGYNDIKGVEFRKGLDIPDDLDPEKHSIIILDDLMREVANSKSAEGLFTKGSHHKNVTVFFLVQNLYVQGVSGHTIRLNCHYYIILNNRTDLDKISRLGRKIGMKETLLLAYKDACESKPYGYLVVDVSPHNPNPQLSIKTNVFPGEELTVYMD